MSEHDRLSRIDTLWTVVRRAHDGQNQEARSAQEELLLRYGTAVRRYLMGAVRDEYVADELFQEFSLRFVSGDYASADPERGRFRAFLKTILWRLVAEHFRKQQRRKTHPLGSAIAETPSPTAPQETNDEFTIIWREELLGKAWNQLERLEQENSRPVYTVMESFVSNPELSSAEQAVRLSEKLGKPISAQNARVILHRARAVFAEYLVAEVRNTLESPTMESLEQELIELKLHSYCRPVLGRD